MYKTSSFQWFHEKSWIYGFIAEFYVGSQILISYKIAMGIREMTERWENDQFMLFARTHIEGEFETSGKFKEEKLWLRRNPKLFRPKIAIGGYTADLVSTRKKVEFESVPGLSQESPVLAA